MDYQDIGFKAGLEIHQQLNTNKLFCSCQSIITEDIDYQFQRRLRPTQSELGDIDRAALEESLRKRHFLYTASTTSTCLVEADEEPPHKPNQEAINICLTLAKLTNAHIVDEISFMRKLVIDGSNTSGFQRTALLAIDGTLNDVSINTIAVEEDSARKIQEKGKLVNYGLDRLGIPLIEITTGPDIKNPTHAKETAQSIGSLLKATKKVKRGLGTIRQDLNISIKNGARVEIKGIQSLSSISRVAEKEAARQQGILETIKTLKQRNITAEHIHNQKNVDLTDQLNNTQSSLINKALKNKNNIIIATILPGFRGLLKKEETRLGKELAIYAKIKTGIGGIIHSDELPGYGLSQQEVDNLEHTLKLSNPATDAMILLIAPKQTAEHAIQAIQTRAEMILTGVTPAVRRSLPDDFTEYMRPLPGAARMYPETDVAPQPITKEHLESLILPELPKEKHNRIKASYNLNNEQTLQLIKSGYEDEFETLVKQYPKQKNTIIRTFLHTYPELEDQHIQTETITTQLLEKLFSALDNNTFSKEALPTLLNYLATHPKNNLQEAITACSLSSIDETELKACIKKLVHSKKEFVETKKQAAVGALMGIAMKELRGKADGAQISKLLLEEINALLKE